MISQSKGRILSNQRLAPNVFLVSLKLPRVATEAVPGQFLHIKTNTGLQPLLRRPFSIHRVDCKQGEVQLLYQVIGKGTKILSHRREGEEIDCLGPAGSGFKMPETKRVLLVAGGMGIAPLIFLAERLKERNLKLTFLIGASSSRYILYEDQLKNWGAEVKVATDEGSRGHKGPVTDLLGEVLPKTSYIFASGPKKMLGKVLKFALRENLPTQLALEEHMACGVGACFGCVVKTKDGYKRACVEGPVFRGEELEAF